NQKERFRDRRRPLGLDRSSLLSTRHERCFTSPPSGERPNGAGTSRVQRQNGWWAGNIGRIHRGGEGVMKQEALEGGNSAGALDRAEVLPSEADAATRWLGSAGLRAARCRDARASGANLPPLPYQWLVLFTRPPQELDVRYEGVNRHVPPAAGSISL